MPELITLRDEDLKGDESKEYFFFDDPTPLQQYYDPRMLQLLQLQQQGLPQYQGQPLQLYQPGQIIIGQTQTFPQEGTLTGIGQTYTIGQGQQNIGNSLGGLFGGLTGSLFK